MRVLAVCLPTSDASFGERVRRLVAQDRWDVQSRDGVAELQSVLRQSYPMATVVSRDGVSAGGVLRTVVLNVFRDGLPGASELRVRWAAAVYDLSGAVAYRTAARILGEGSAAESVVEQAFREVRPRDPDGLSVEAGGAAVEAASLRIANDARAARDAGPGDETSVEPTTTTAPAEASLRKGTVRRKLTERALTTLPSSQRQTLELALAEDLKVSEVAERLQTTSAAVHRHLREALLAVDEGVPPTAATTLARWRQAQRSWAELPDGDPSRAARGLEVAHAWLDYQTASGSVPREVVVLVTDADRRFVTTSGNAGQMLGRPSVVGLRIDDVTAEYARPLLPDLWAVFDETGGMQGEYDCARPTGAPVRVPFRGVWGRPLPDLQVGFLQPPVPTPIALTAPEPGGRSQ